MKFKDYVMLMGASLALGFILSWTLPNPIAEPTPQPKVDTTIVITNVKGKTALFIGDSHTANHSNGWQIQLSKLVGFKMINASVGGKTTYWMIDQAVYRINESVDYCFIYGGANDMWNGGVPQEAVDNIKSIARVCKGRGVRCVVLTGFDAVKCTKTSNLKYPERYTEFQRLLMSQDMEGATVVDTRVVDRKDCWDGLCHMAPSGHKKIAEKIVKDLALQRI
jgi:lysophospholipase L1-like esterase